MEQLTELLTSLCVLSDTSHGMLRTLFDTPMSLWHLKSCSILNVGKKGSISSLSFFSVYQKLDQLKKCIKSLSNECKIDKKIYIWQKACPEFSWQQFWDFRPITMHYCSVYFELYCRFNRSQQMMGTKLQNNSLLTSHGRTVESNSGKK